MSDEAVETEHSASGHASVVPTNLEMFMPYVCQQLNMPFVVAVHRRQQAEYVPKALVARRMSRRIPHQASRLDQSKESEEEGSGPVRQSAWPSDRILNMVAVLDSVGRVVEVQVERCVLPCLYVKVLHLTLPYQPVLERLSARRCRLRGAALAELAALPLRCTLTDLCLDDSPVPEGNYADLLDHDRLRRLSLARCSLDDTTVIQIAARLALGGAAAHSLRTLDLTSNRIGDAGARALAVALRTNRTLLHLNLAGNEIGDEGGRELFAVLAEFVLTVEEIEGKRRRRMAYVRQLAEVTARCLARLEAAGRTASTGGEEARRKRTASTRAPVTDLSLGGRAEGLALEVVGPDEDPYCPAETVARNGRLYCRGDWALLYLNVAYNSLTMCSLTALQRALTSQVSHRRPGLLRVIVDGNELPVATTRYAACESLLDQAINARNAKSSLLKRYEHRLERPKSKA